MITRTFKTFKAQAIKLDYENGKPTAKVLGECEFVGTSPSKTEVRKALREAGVNVPKGTKINVEVVAETILGMDESTFAYYAQEVTRKEQQD